MDPQLEEYRRRQRERCASDAAASGKSQRLTFVGLGLAALLLVAGAAVLRGLEGPRQATAQEADQGLSDAFDVKLDEDTPPRTYDPRCPPVEGRVGVCVEQCSSNADCSSGLLCCSNGCGHVCMEPGAPKKEPRPCVLMIVMESKDAEEALLASVPPPSSQNVLGSMGIMILNYDEERQAECCKAYRSLQAHPSAKSVEWDGPAPNCHAEL
mmetsp:Transcript_123576/g.344072  ORF Transcript_123576/g.344072 Transcript_123576/m.344072 type:complete len:211 (-) Transcript_123576:56-688(-)